MPRFASPRLVHVKRGIEVISCVLTENIYLSKNMSYLAAGDSTLLSWPTPSHWKVATSPAEEEAELR